jgi:hypothetical protein
LRPADGSDSTQDAISTGIDIQSTVDRGLVPRFTKTQFSEAKFPFLLCAPRYPICGFLTLPDAGEMCGTATAKEQNLPSNNRMKTSVAWSE